MGNCNCNEPASQSAPTLGEVVDSLQAVLDTTDLNQFVHIIKRLLEEKSSDGASTSTSAIAEENKGMLTSFVRSGAKFLEFVNGRTEKIEDKNDLFSENSTIVTQIVGLIGQFHWVVGGLSIVAYLIEKVDEVSANEREALELLGKMVDLATTVIKLRDVVPEEEEKFKKAFMLVVQGSIMCVSQMYSEKIFRFLKTSVNSEKLKKMSKTLDHHYQDLILAISLSRYNELEESTKDAFLDTCWFFSGWNRRHVEYVVGADEVQLLIEAALVTPYVDDNLWNENGGEERLRVHDIVKAIGRSMSASTRFNDVESFSKAVQDETKLNGIKGLHFRRSLSEYVLDVQHLNSMRHSLRILALGDDMRTSAQSRMKFNELRYLNVSENIPQLPMKVEELGRLGMYGGPIGLRGMSMNKLPKTLRYMWISSQIETFPTSGVHNHSLEELHIPGGNIKQFPEGLHQLCSLKILTLFLYNEMEEFPEQVCELSSLIKLTIFWWHRLKHLPESFGRLKGLTYLAIIGCDELEELPSSFGQLTALEHLILESCSQLKELPRGLDSLKYLHVSSGEHLSVESYQNKPGLSIVIS